MRRKACLLGSNATASGSRQALPDSADHVGSLAFVLVP